MASNRRSPNLVLSVLLVALVFAGVWFVWPEDESGSSRKEERAAVAALRAGRFEEARIRYSRLLALAPDDPERRQNLSVALLELGRTTEAAEWARGTLERVPDFAPAHALLAELCRRSGEWNDAIAHARAATRGRRVEDRAWLSLAGILLDAGQTTEGVLALTRAVENGRGGGGAEIRLATLLGSVEVSPRVEARARNVVLAGLERARAALADSPSDPVLLRRLGTLALAAKQPEVAAAALIQARARRPLDPAETTLLVRAMAASGRRDAAREILARKAERAEDRGGLEEVAAWLTVADPESALAVLDGLPEEERRGIRALRLRLKTIQMLIPVRGEAALLDDIERTTAAILAIRPLDQEARDRRIRGMLATGRHREALREAIALRKLAPAAPGGPWLQGLTLFALGRPSDALPLLRVGRTAAGSDAKATRWILRVALHAGAKDVAREEVDRLGDEPAPALRAAAAALLGDPDRAEFLLAGGAFAAASRDDRILAVRLLADAGRPGPARALAESLAAESAGFGELVTAGDLLAAAGERERALALWRRAAARKEDASAEGLFHIGASALDREGPRSKTLALARERLADVEGGGPLLRLLAAREGLADGRTTEALAAARERLAVAPTDPDSLDIQLEALLASGADPSLVRAAADRLLEVVPNHARARSIRADRLFDEAMAAAGAGEREDFEAKLARVLELTPGAVRPLFFRAIGRLSGGDLRAAEEDARALIANEESRARGFYLLGIVRFLDARYDDAAEAFRTSIEADPEPGGRREALALCLLSAGKHEKAHAVAAECGALAVEAAALLALGRGEEAVGRVRAALAAEPDSVSLGLLVGRTLLSAGRPGEAAEVFAGMLGRRPGFTPALEGLLIARVRAGDAEAARAKADRAVADAASRVDALLLRSRLRWSTGDREGAVDDLRGAARAAPDRPDVLAALGERLVALDVRSEARRRLERALDLDPRRPRALILLGLLAEREERPAEAEERYSRALELDPGNAAAGNNLAVLLLDRPGELPRALELASRAVRARPGNGQFRDTLASALAANLHAKEAAKEAGEALRLLPNDPEIALNAARIYGAAGLPERAVEATERARAAATDEDREGIEKRIERILAGLPR